MEVVGVKERTVYFPMPWDSGVVGGWVLCLNRALTLL